MIDVYYWPTPNGHKITIMVEECGLEYRMVPINISLGEQFEADFLKIAPNNRMPAIVDDEAEGGSLSIFESGAILEYLAEKTGRFMPNELHRKYDVLQWLHWQMGGVGPMFGQTNHFIMYAPQLSDLDLTYGKNRYLNESKRLLRVLNTQLEGQDFVAGDYSIADMAIWPWVNGAHRVGLELDELPNVARWREVIEERPAVVRAIAVGKKISEEAKSGRELSEDAKDILFGSKQV